MCTPPGPHRPIIPHTPHALDFPCVTQGYQPGAVSRTLVAPRPASIMSSELVLQAGMQRARTTRIALHRSTFRAEELDPTAPASIPTLLVMIGPLGAQW
jgi:hypothetical protein